ncbi:universal stress protein [Deinococcus sp. YIM 134068]|uniref:universal stress protein n=1 Tax=Deinococcus lichenicola TaxID=3118910 RepID=UPI002F91CE4D
MTRPQGEDEGGTYVRPQTLDFPEARIVCRETTGRPVSQVIADDVERLGAALVVMSTHGWGGLVHFLLGSVAEAVLHRVKVPVFLVRAPADPTGDPAAGTAGAPVASGKRTPSRPAAGPPPVPAAPYPRRKDHARPGRHARPCHHR